MSFFISLIPRVVKFASFVYDHIGKYVYDLTLFDDAEIDTNNLIKSSLIPDSYIGAGGGIVGSDLPIHILDCDINVEYEEEEEIFPEQFSSLTKKQKDFLKKNYEQLMPILDLELCFDLLTQTNEEYIQFFQAHQTQKVVKTQQQLEQLIQQLFILQHTNAHPSRKVSMDELNFAAFIYHTKLLQTQLEHLQTQLQTQTIMQNRIVKMKKIIIKLLTQSPQSQSQIALPIASSSSSIASQLSSSSSIASQISLSSSITSPITLSSSIASPITSPITPSNYKKINTLSNLLKQIYMSDDRYEFRYDQTQLLPDEKEMIENKTKPTLADYPYDLRMDITFNQSEFSFLSKDEFNACIDILYSLFCVEKGNITRDIVAAKSAVFFLFFNVVIDKINLESIKHYNVKSNKIFYPEDDFYLKTTGTDMMALPQYINFNNFSIKVPLVKHKVILFLKDDKTSFRFTIKDTHNKPTGNYRYGKYIYEAIIRDCVQLQLPIPMPVLLQLTITNTVKPVDNVIPVSVVNSPIIITNTSNIFVYEPSDAEIMIFSKITKYNSVSNICIDEDETAFYYFNAEMMSILDKFHDIKTTRVPTKDATYVIKTYIQPSLKCLINMCRLYNNRNNSYEFDKNGNVDNVNKFNKFDKFDKLCIFMDLSLIHI